MDTGNNIHVQFVLSVLYLLTYGVLVFRNARVSKTVDYITKINAEKFKFAIFVFITTDTITIVEFINHSKYKLCNLLCSN